MSRESVPLKNPAKAALLAWLVPGLGHFYQGRTGKGILYAVCIIGLYSLGLILGEGKVVFWTWINPLADSEHFRLSFLFQAPFGAPAILALFQSVLKWYGEQPIFWGFLAEPSQNAINGLQSKLGGIVEIAWVYTTVAGLLNVLAIYDAYDGPAHIDEPEGETEPTSATAEAPAAETGAVGGVKVEGRI
jgi:TM2 domain-containing membrane protein YozV